MRKSCLRGFEWWWIDQWPPIPLTCYLLCCDWTLRIGYTNHKQTKKTWCSQELLARGTATSQTTNFSAFKIIAAVVALFLLTAFFECSIPPQPLIQATKSTTQWKNPKIRAALIKVALDLFDLNRCSNLKKSGVFRWCWFNLYWPGTECSKPLAKPAEYEQHLRLPFGNFWTPSS